MKHDWQSGGSTQDRSWFFCDTCGKWVDIIKYLSIKDEECPGPPQVGDHDSTTVSGRQHLKLDFGIVEAVQAWIDYGLDPGSCTRLLLEGNYDEALQHAHPLIKPYWEDHIAFIESLPEECRGKNMAAWKGKKGRSE